MRISRCCATIDRHWDSRRYSELGSKDTVGLGIRQGETRSLALPYRAIGRHYNNARDNEAGFPLPLASGHGRLDMAQLLLDHGLDPNIQEDAPLEPVTSCISQGPP